MLKLKYKDIHNNMMHIGFRKDFSKKTESFGGRGVGRRERMKDKCKVGSLNIFFAFRLPTYHY